MPTPMEVMLCSSKTTVVHRRQASHSDTMGRMEGLHQGAHLYLIPLSWITPNFPTKLHASAFKRIQVIQGPQSRGISQHTLLTILVFRDSPKELNYVFTEPLLVTFKTAQRMGVGSED